MIVRDIKFKDLDSVYDLLNQLTFVETSLVDKSKAWKEFNCQGLVVEYKNKIIGYGSLVIENKIRGYQSGQIEDVVVDENWRGYGVGEKLIKALVERAWEKKCYRLSLFCKEELVPFYEKNNFIVNNVVMKQWNDKT